MQKESDFQRNFIQILRLKKVEFWRQSIGAVLYRCSKNKLVFGRNSMKGFPDVCGVTKRGRFWAAELKSAKGRLSPEQVSWIARLKATNAIVVVLYSMDEAMEFIEHLVNN